MPGLTDSVESSTGAPSEITIRMRRCSGRAQQALVRPQQRLAVDVLLQQPLAQHQAEVLARAPPGRVGRLVDDVAQVVEAARDCAACPRRATARGYCPPFQARVVKPRISTFTRAALQRARQDVGAHRGDGDRPAAHRAGIVDQQRDDGVAELGLLLELVGQRHASG